MADPVIVIVGALGWAAMPRAAAALGSMGVAALLAGLMALRGASAWSEGRSRELDLKNPFRLRSAVKFALLFGLVLVASKLAQQYLPGVGLYGLSALAGSTDVDAVALSLLELLSDGDATALLVVQGLIIAAVANTWAKLLLTFILGDRRLFCRLVVPSISISLVGGLMIVFIR